jgi:hypothetical protein
MVFIIGVILVYLTTRRGFERPTTQGIMLNNKGRRENREVGDSLCFFFTFPFLTFLSRAPFHTPIQRSNNSSGVFAAISCRICETLLPFIECMGWGCMRGVE